MPPIADSVVPSLVKAAEAVARYLVLVNAGGAAASLSFYGVAFSEGAPNKLIVIPLTLFLIGLILAGLVLISDIYAAAGRMIAEAETHGGRDTAEQLISEVLDPFGKPGLNWPKLHHAMLQAGALAVPGSYISFILGAFLGVLGLIIG